MSTLDKVVAAVCDITGIYEEEVTGGAEFDADLGCDSLDVLDIVMAIEEEFNLEIPDDDAERLVRVSDMVEYLDRRLAGRAA